MVQMGASCKITSETTVFINQSCSIETIFIYHYKTLDKAFTPINRGKRLIYFVSNVTCKPAYLDRNNKRK